MTAVQRPLGGRTLLKNISNFLVETVSTVEGSFEPRGSARGTRFGLALTTSAGRALVLAFDERRLRWRLTAGEEPARRGHTGRRAAETRQRR
jgi:hypothetical protein